MTDAVAKAHRSDRGRLGMPPGGRVVRHLLAAATGLVLGVDMWLQLTVAWSRRRPARSTMAATAALARRTGRLLAVVTAGALGIEAWVHLTTASSYAANGGAILNEGNAFLAEAAVAVAAAIHLLVRPGRLASILALAVASSALAAVLISTYVDIGTIGPIPDFYEPTWAVPGKVLATAAEAVATVASLTDLLLARRAMRR